MPLSMAKLVLKWVFRQPETSRYPFEPREPVAGSRGKLHFEIENCIYCKICEKKCPTQAIVVDRVGKTWGIDRLRCISCGACVEACPKKSLELEGMHASPAVKKEVESHAKPATEDPKAGTPKIPVKLVPPESPVTTTEEVAQK